MRQVFKYVVMTLLAGVLPLTVVGATVTPATAAPNAYKAPAGYADKASRYPWMGNPTSDEMRASNGFYYQNFERGVVFNVPTQTSSSFGYRLVALHGAIYERWRATGGINGPFGYPKTDEANASGNGAVRQVFTGGDGYWAPGAGAWFVANGNKQEWERLGGLYGNLGAPTGNEIALGANRVLQTFEHGRIYWSPQYGARAVHGAILNEYLARGGHTWLGMPMTGELKVDEWGTTRFQDFENVRISWHMPDKRIWKGACGLSFTTYREIKGWNEASARAHFAKQPCDDTPIFWELT